MDAVQLDLLPSQIEILQSTHRFVAISGGLGCGKSFGLGVKAFQMATMWYGEQGFIVSKTHKQLFDFLLPEIMKVFNVLAPGRWKMKDGNKIILDYGGQPSVIHLLLSNNMAYLNWPGANIGWALMDEWDTMDRAMDVWSYLNDRVRLKPKKGQIRQTAVFSSPEGYGAMYRTFKKAVDDDPKKAKEFQLIYGCTFDNPNLDPDYIRQQILTREPRQAQAYLYGRFCTLSGAVVYDRYKAQLCSKDKPGSDGNHTLATLADFPPDTSVHWGFDWNTGVNPATAHVINEDTGDTFAVFQIRGLKTGIDTIQKIKQDFGDRDMWFYPDAQNTECREALKQTFGEDRVIYTPGNPRVRDRIAALHFRIHSPITNERHYFVNPETCAHLDDSLQHQQFNDKDEPDKKAGYDHDNDSTSYAVYHRFPAASAGSPQIITLD